MRRRPDWMRPTDDLILDTLASSELVLTPAVIAYNLDLDRSHVNKRLSEFVEHNLVDRVDRGYYSVTEKGLTYLRGELDVKEVESADEG